MRIVDDPFGQLTVRLAMKIAFVSLDFESEDRCKVTLPVVTVCRVTLLTLS